VDTLGETSNPLQIKKFRRLLDGTFLFEKTGCLLQVLK